MINITDNTFKDEIKYGLILVDFWAPWCSPCKMLSPILEELQLELGDKITIKKLNTDENQEISAQLNISSIPQLHLYKDGIFVDKVIGAYPKNTLRKFIDNFL